ncbi:MAG: hypothetical protein C1942_05820 [Prosthecochloris sp.]|nr:hypothetical protein [Prosthecochloris sp.]
MRNNYYHIIIFTLFILSGCASTGFLMAKPEVMMLGEAGPSKSPTDKIDIYYTKKPESNYAEIAKISVGDTDDDWCIKQIKLKAKELGADGAIIIGRVGSYGMATGNNTMLLVSCQWHKVA